MKKRKRKKGGFDIKLKNSARLFQILVSWFGKVAQSWLAISELLLPLFQNESCCTTFHIEIRFSFAFIVLQMNSFPYHERLCTRTHFKTEGRKQHRSSLLVVLRSTIDLSSIPVQCVNNSTGARLDWTFLYSWCTVFVQPDLDSAPLFVGMRERSIYLISLPSCCTRISCMSEVTQWQFLAVLWPKMRQNRHDSDL